MANSDLTDIHFFHTKPEQIPNQYLNSVLYSLYVTFHECELEDLICEKIL